MSIQGIVGESSRPDSAPTVPLIHSSDESEFLVGQGCCYLWCLFSTSVILAPFFCCPYNMMKTQRVSLDDLYLRHQFDSFLLKVDKMVPLDRIQDVNINENCCERCCCVTEIQVQTAGGGKSPEIVIFAPKQPKEMRDRIMRARDAVAHRLPSRETEHLLSSSGSAIAADQAILSQEMKSMVDSLQRIEHIMTRGLEKL
jgi:hypothetical protein